MVKHVMTTTGVAFFPLYFWFLVQQFLTLSSQNSRRRFQPRHLRFAV